MIKLFASDLDGTLLKNHLSDDIVREAVKKLREKNREFVIATGRSLYPEQRRKLGFEEYGIYTICMSGALILGPTEEEIFRYELKRDFVGEVLERFPHMMLEYITAEAGYYLQSRPEYITVVQKRKGGDTTLTQSFLNYFLPYKRFECSREDIMRMGVLKIGGYVENEEQANKFLEFIKSRNSLVANRPYRTDSFEVTMQEANKGNAVAFLMERLGISENEVAVYGDSENDLEMLRRFPHSYVPMNGAPVAKAVASEVIGLCDEYAVANHMLRLTELR